MKEPEKEIHPPKWAERFLSWYCKPDLLEDLQGDLNEYFERNVKSEGARRAKLIYIIDVVKFLRLYTVRKPKWIDILINWIMLGSYVKTSGRSIMRHKLFSAINIAGLAISMSVGLLLIGVVNDMFSYDAFHEKRNRIYRVISKYGSLGHSNDTYNASSSLRTGKAIEEAIPGVEEVAMLRRGFGGDMKVDNKTIPLYGLWANDATFRVFTFPLLQGDAATALKNPFSIVLTEKSAYKLFGDGEAIGKTITLKEKEYTITGVMKDVPVFSHIRFEMLASLSTREITQKDNKNELAWDNMWSNYTYILLPENTDLQTLQSNLDVLSAKEDKTVKDTNIKLALQPLTAIAMGEELNNSIGPVMESSVVWMIGILSFVVLLSACFNYTNLSIARSFKRSREVGIRKVIGAMKSHVRAQFITEAVLISLCALAIAFVLFIVLRPYVISINPRIQEMLVLNLSPTLILYFILLTVIVGLAAGLFPAMFFSRINAIQVMKNLSTLRVFKNLNVRKTLIVIQYTISISFIAATIISYKQYKHMLSFNLGFQTENILNINLQDNNADLLIKELSEVPEVNQLSRSGLITSIGTFWSRTMKYKDPLDSINIYFNEVDENYIPLLGHRLLAGRNFTAKPKDSKEYEAIINEKTMKRFSIGNNNPTKALDEFIEVDGRKIKVVGVMEDFHYGKMESKISEVIFLYNPWEAEVVNVKINPGDLVATIAKIEMAWKKMDNIHPMEASFYDDAIERAYSEYESKIKIIGFLAFLAIFIASIRLLGMVVFTTETRLKELSIRKVLGASEGSLVYLLSKSFLILLVIAALIALPITYLYFDQVVLSKFTYRAPISVIELLIGLAAVILLAFIMIGSQTLKATRANPADVLKSE